MRYAWLLLLVLVGGCQELRLPSEQEMMAVFITEEVPGELVPEPPPADVPVLAVSELTDWTELCSDCHVGPHFSSHTILRWGHLESCVGGMACGDCHHEELHRTDVRGDKGMCFECHLAQGVPVACETCHVEGCRGSHAAHDSRFLGEHGQHQKWLELACTKCHGSQQWCDACHGLPMPHPENIIDVHPELVQGRPDACANCHGSQSCIRCHLALGVVIGQQQ